MITYVHLITDIAGFLAARMLNDGVNINIGIGICITTFWFIFV
jgi:hypothetical protein